MAVVNVLNVAVLDNPSAFTAPFQFEITFDCLRELPAGSFRSLRSPSRVSALRRSVRCFRNAHSLLLPRARFSAACRRPRVEGHLRRIA